MRFVKHLLPLILCCSLLFPLSLFAKKKVSVSGLQNVAVILVDLKGDQKEQSPDEIHEALFTAQYSVANFFKESSYGKVELKGDLFGWYHVDPLEKRAT